MVIRCATIKCDLAAEVDFDNNSPTEWPSKLVVSWRHQILWMVFIPIENCTRSPSDSNWLSRRHLSKCFIWCAKTLLLPSTIHLIVIDFSLCFMFLLRMWRLSLRIVSKGKDNITCRPISNEGSQVTGNRTISSHHINWHIESEGNEEIVFGWIEKRYFQSRNKNKYHK